MSQLDVQEGFKEVPHRADVAIKAWSCNLAGLFVQAACGLYFLMGVKKGSEHNILRTIELNESDLEMLLIKFLNEIIQEVQLRSVIYDELNIQIQQNCLYGELKGQKISRLVREIKAATYHECKILQTAAGYKTMIVFDI